MNLIVETDNITCAAIKRTAKAFQCIHGYAFIVLQVIYGMWVYTMLVYQGISRNILLFHCLPKRRIVNHSASPQHNYVETFSY